MLETIPKHLILEDISKSQYDPKFKIYVDTIIKFDYKKQNYEIFIENGFETDLGSVPKRFRGIVSNVSKFNPVWLLHDFLYDKKCELNFTRKQADEILLEKLKEFQMSFIKRWIAYYGVRIIAGKRWKR